MQIDLSRRLGYDMLVVRANMPRDEGAMRHEPSSHVGLRRFHFHREIQENTWRQEDQYGFWATTRYEPVPDVLFPADHSIARGGMVELERYVEAYEKEPVEEVDESQYIGLEYAIKNRGDLAIGGYADQTGPYLTAWVVVWFEALILAPELAQRYMDITMKGMMAALRHQLKLGVDFVMGGNDMYGKHACHISKDHFCRFVRPYLKMIVDECHKHGVPYVKHYDGNTQRDWNDLWVDLGIDGYHSIEPTAGMDIGEVKRAHGDHLVVLGNLDSGEVLTNGTPQEVIDGCKEIFRKAAPGGGFVLSSSNSIHGTIPPENVYAMVEAAQKYGTYPIGC